MPTWHHDKRRRRSRTKQLQHRPYFKDHFLAVVEFVYRSRYATVAHIYERFPEHFGTLRTCRNHVDQLVHEYKLLKEVPARTSDPTFPTVYVTSAKGRKRLAAERQLAINPNLRDEAVQRDTLLHELYITNFELCLTRAMASRPDLRLVASERRYHLKENQLAFAYQGTRHKLEPDASFLLAQTKQNTTGFLLHFLELDRGTENAATLVNKFRTYDDWYRSDDGNAYVRAQYEKCGSARPHHNFRLLVVIADPAGDRRRLVNIFLQALERPELLRPIWFTTRDDVEAAAAQSDNNPLTKAIWYRGLTVLDWLADYQRFTESPTAGHKAEEYVAFMLQDTKQKACLLPSAG